MSEKSGFQSSLFAGMNLGRSKAASSSKTFTSLSGKEESNGTSNEESVNTKSVLGSSFSFIKDSNGPEKKERDNKNEISLDNATSVIDLFDVLDDGKSSVQDGQICLSYSDQLAEILPGTTPLGGGVIPSYSSGDGDSDSSKHIPHYETGSGGNDSEKDKKLHLKAKENCKESDNDEVEEISEIEESDVLSVKRVKDVKYDLELDPEENLTLFYSQHSFKLTKLSEERDELRCNICALYQDVMSKMSMLEDQLKKMKTDFEDALSNDDYDLAAEINEQMEELNNRKFELECSRPKLLNTKIQEFFNRIFSLREREKEFHEWVLGKYENLYKEQNDLLEKRKQRCSNEMNDKKDELGNERDKIKRALQHLELDKEHSAKDKADLDGKINSKLEVFQNRKEELCSKQIELQDEIERLEKRLKELRSEKTNVENSIKDEDDNMVAVRKEFENLEMEINERWSEVKGKEEILNRKLEEVSLKENELDQTAAHVVEKEERLEKNILYLTTNKKESEIFIESVREKPDKNLSEVFFTCLPQHHGENLIKLRSLEKAKAKNLQDLELQVFNKEQAISSKKKRLTEIRNQVPDLETAKKSAVTDHNFKEAKRVNEMIKQLTQEIETSTEEMADLENTLAEDKQRTELLKQDYSSVKNNVLQAKKEYDSAGVARIMAKTKRLFELNTSILEDDAFKTLRNQEISLLKAELTLLQETSEGVMLKLGEDDLEKLDFVKKILAEHETAS